VSYRFRVPLDPGAGWWLVVVCGVVAVVLLAVSLVSGRTVDVVFEWATATPEASVTPAAGVTPEAAVPSGSPRVGALGAAGPSQVFPPVEAVIEHYFGPLGASVDAERVWRCETGPEAVSWVGAAGELGPFQLSPDGAGKRFVDAGWNLLDAQQNVIAAALVVAEDGWGAWSACY
jgi:hypothetical protein